MSTIGEIESLSMEAPRFQGEVEETVLNGNFVLRIRLLVSEILGQLSRISDNDRKQVETLKREYRVASREAAQMQIKIGNAAPWISGVAFVTVLSQFLWTNSGDRGMIKFLGEQVPNVGTAFTSRYSSKQMEFGAVRDLRNTEINAKNSKTQSESGSKQEVTALLNSAFESMKKASSTN